jgi:predicted transcriptional regulator
MMAMKTETSTEAATTTLTVRVPVALKEQLGELAGATRRSNSFLATEAITEYVESELAFAASIEQARADIKAGRGIPHEDVLARVKSMIAEKEAGKISPEKIAAE